MTAPAPDAALVTGAAGFIGQRLSLALCADGIKVRGLVRAEHDAARLEAAGVEIVRADAADRDAVADAMRGCPVVYHLAAMRGHRKLGVRGFDATNRAITESIAEAALAAGVRRVIVSSAAAVMAGAVSRARADGPPQPNSGYRHSKAVVEQVFRQYRDTRGLDVVIARVARRVLGPGARGWSRLFRSVRDGRIRVVPRGGVLHSCDIDDTVAGLRLCAGPAARAGDLFVLVAREAMPMREVLAAIAAELDVPFAPRVLPAMPFRVYQRLGNAAFKRLGVDLPHHFTAEFYASPVVYDTAETPERLGFAPRYTIRESIARTAAWFRAEGDPA